MTEREWSKCHPAQCQAYVKAWKNKNERENARSAALQHIIAISGGVKIKGRNPRFEDFMVTEKKEKVNPMLAEARLKLALQAWAKQSQKKK